MNISSKTKSTAFYHLPGLFEFYELYSVFLPLFYEHREYFYEWCEIGSIYGAPADCIWGGGRVGFGENDAKSVLALMQKYNISARLTFSNSLLEAEHLSDKKCNRLCSIFAENPPNNNELNDSTTDKADISADYINANTNTDNNSTVTNGVIVHSELLLNYLKENYPQLYLVSSTTKVITDFAQLKEELMRSEFRYVVPDFRLNKAFDGLKKLSDELKDKVEFLCNEACYFGCKDRKGCYENVSRKNLGIDLCEHECKAPNSHEGYRFSNAMKNPGFIGISDIQEIYLPMGFSNFKIEGRGLGSALVLEFLLYYMTKPEYQLRVREEIYLDAMLDLF